MKTKLIATVDSNGYLDDGYSRMRKALKQFIGKSVEITIEKQKNKRSNEQNRYYWGVVIALTKKAIEDINGEPIGQTDVHDLLRSRLLYHESLNEKTALKVPKTTTELSTIEFEKYMDDCRNWAKEYLNIDVPEPNEFEFE